MEVFFKFKITICNFKFCWMILGQSLRDNCQERTTKVRWASSCASAQTVSQGPGLGNNIVTVSFPAFVGGLRNIRIYLHQVNRIATLITNTDLDITLSTTKSYLKKYWFKIHCAHWHSITNTITCSNYVIIMLRNIHSFTETKTALFYAK